MPPLSPSPRFPLCSFVGGVKLEYTWEFETKKPSSNKENNEGKTWTTMNNELTAAKFSP